MTARSPVGRAEIALLAALLFTLPLLEVPKQLCWLGWAVLAGRALWRDRHAPGAGLSAWDAVLAAMLGAVLLSGLGAPAPAGWRGAGDVLRLVSVPWLMMRRGYRAADCRVPLLAALAGVAVASLWGLARVLTADTPVFLQLHSVGHVNHSAIYLAVAIGVAVAAWVGIAPTATARARLLIGASGLIALVALFVSGSRAAALALALLLGLIAWLTPFPLANPARDRRRFRLGLVAVLAAALTGYLALAGFSGRALQPDGAGLVGKFRLQSGDGGGLTSHRDRLARLAFAAGQAYPLFGLGVDGFGRLTPARVCAEIAPPPPGGVCDTSGYTFTAHAHSLYGTVFAEQGSVGLAAVLALLAAWAGRLRRSLAWARADRDAAAVWLAALSGLVITAAAGLLNTTLHHEHGLLAMTGLGMLLSASAARAVPSQRP
ncbi:MAG: O-antigen ligase family protein [Betaproteobacteria bacterium]|nr:O-antigen ligase family protein [Betaproteobacteria bacterium]